MYYKNIITITKKLLILHIDFRHILASASVDQTVILWDLDELIPHTTLTNFKEKVQTIVFHYNEAHSLLTGSCDGTVNLFDCREPNTCKAWLFSGEIERVVWDPFKPNNFFAATNSGKIYYSDIRQSQKLWSKRVHDQEVTGIVINPKCEEMLTTASADGILKIWKYGPNGIHLIHAEETNIGRIQCLTQCPDDPFTIAIGGDNKRKNLRVMDIRNFTEGTINVSIIFLVYNLI